MIEGGTDPYGDTYYYFEFNGELPTHLSFTDGTDGSVRTANITPTNIELGPVYFTDNLVADASKYHGYTQYWTCVENPNLIEAENKRHMKYCGEGLYNLIPKNDWVAVLNKVDIGDADNKFRYVLGMGEPEMMKEYVLTTGVSCLTNFVSPMKNDACVFNILTGQFRGGFTNPVDYDKTDNCVLTIGINNLGGEAEHCSVPELLFLHEKVQVEFKRPLPGEPLPFTIDCNGVGLPFGMEDGCKYKDATLAWVDNDGFQT